MWLSEFLARLQRKIAIYLIRTRAYPTQMMLSWREHSLYKDIERHRIQIPSRDKDRSIDGWIYYPKNYDADAEPGIHEPMPVLVNWHGSGFVVPSLGTDALFCARVAREAGIIVIDADYRKAPENPFPAALHDVEDALTWVASQSHRFDSSRVGVSGFSAGGNLALVAASSRRAYLEATGAMHIPLVIAFYPPTDLGSDIAAVTVPKPALQIPHSIHELFRKSYLPDDALRKDPLVSPAFAGVGLFPENVVILTCECDNLSPEANDLADKLDDGHRKVVNKTLDDVPHAWDKKCKVGTNYWNQRELGYELAISNLKEAFKLGG